MNTDFFFSIFFNHKNPNNKTTTKKQTKQNNNKPTKKPIPPKTKNKHKTQTLTRHTVVWKQNWIFIKQLRFC